MSQYKILFSETGVLVLQHVIININNELQKFYQVRCGVLY